MIDNLIWNFPKSGFSTQSSSDNNNIDTFSDDRIGNLVREILQNSLDASLNDQAVRVEFRSFKTKTKAFPGLNSFKQYLQNWKDNQLVTSEDDKDLLFVNRALEELNKEEMVWLRISDFNTTGLWGSTSNNSRTPYFSFVHGAGKNSKQSVNSGGSKGVGKNAIFANSNLQTLFISTLTKDNERAFIGVGFLVSSDDNDINKDWTQGIGFCVKNDEHALNNKPVQDLNNLDVSFDRSKQGYGTDIYIPSFICDEDWMRQISGQVLYSFLPAILKKKLSVHIVDGLTDLDIEVSSEINSSNLSFIVNQSSTYKSRFQRESCLNIYNALTSSKGTIFVSETKPGFKMTMYLLEDDFSGDNKLYLYRCPTRMLIKTQEINAFVKCTGVLLVEGEEITQRLRSIEDATHSKWSKSKANKTKYSVDEIEEALSSVNNFIELKANNFGNKDMSTESDFDYMIENDWCSADDEHEIAKETLKEIGLPISRASFSTRNDPSKHSKKRKPLKRKSTEINNEDPDATSFLEQESFPGDGEEASFPNGNNEGFGGELHEGGETRDVDKHDGAPISLVRKNVATALIKMPSVNPKEGLFNLVFIPRSSGSNVEIEISIIGTGSSDVIPINILKAKHGLFSLKTKKNKLYMKRIDRGTKYKISLKLEVNQNYIWEVNINADE